MPLQNSSALPANPGYVQAAAFPSVSPRVAMRKTRRKREVLGGNCARLAPAAAWWPARCRVAPCVLARCFDGAGRQAETRARRSGCSRITHNRGHRDYVAPAKHPRRRTYRRCGEQPCKRPRDGAGRPRSTRRHHVYHAARCIGAIRKQLTLMSSYMVYKGSPLRVASYLFQRRLTGPWWSMRLRLPTRAAQQRMVASGHSH